MTKRMDEMRIANAFHQAAVGGHYEQCSNVIKNFAHVYREDYQAVLSMVSVMLMDPTISPQKNLSGLRRQSERQEM